MEKLDLGKWPAPAGAKPSATYFEISLVVLGRLPSSSQRRVPTRSNMNSLNRLTSTNRTEHRASLRKRRILASQMRIAGAAQTVEDIGPFFPIVFLAIPDRTVVYHSLYFQLALISRSGGY
jgi:hypothetical protein